MIGAVHRFGDPAHRFQPMIDNRTSVQHGAAGAEALLDSLLGLLKFQVARVGVGGVREQIGSAAVLKALQQGDMVFDQGHAAARLDQGAPLLLRVLLRRGRSSYGAGGCGDRRRPPRDRGPFR